MIHPILRAAGTGGRSRRRRCASGSASAAATVLALILLCDRPAWGHAVLTDSEPRAGVTLAAGEAPAHVRLLFNERVEPGFNTIRVIDAAGRRHDRGRADIRDDGTVVDVALDGLPPGAYTVIWRVNSIDGHQVRGYFGFGVGAPPPDDASMVLAAAGRTSRAWAVWVGFVRAIGLMSISLWMGGVGFIALVYGPALSARPDSAPAPDTVLDAGRRVQRLAHLAGIAFLVVQGVAFLNQAAVLADASLAQAAAPSVSLTILTGTNYGKWWAIRIGSASALLSLAAWLLRRGPAHVVIARRPLAWMLAASLGALMLLTWPLTGHAGAVRPLTAAAVGSDWLHLAATIVWVGGVAALATVAWSLRRASAADQSLLGGLPRRFSPIALGCVIVLAVTGACNAWLHVPSVSALTRTSYGRALLLKLGLLLPILVLALVNRRAVRRMATPPPAGSSAQAWAGRMRAALSGEAVLLAVVLGVVAWLTSVPPATASARSGHFEESVVRGDLRVTLILHPNRVGRNEISVALHHAVSGQVLRARAAAIFVKPLDVESGIESVDAALSTEGLFQAVLVVPTAGRALVSVQITPESGDAFVVEFESDFGTAS